MSAGSFMPKIKTSVHATRVATVLTGGATPRSCTGPAILTSGNGHETKVTVVRASGGTLSVGGAGLATGLVTGVATTLLTSHSSAPTGPLLNHDNVTMGTTSSATAATDVAT